MVTHLKQEKTWLIKIQRCIKLPPSNRIKLLGKKIKWRRREGEGKKGRGREEGRKEGGEGKGKRRKKKGEGMKGGNQVEERESGEGNLVSGNFIHPCKNTKHAIKALLENLRVSKKIFIICFKIQR